MSPWKWRPQRTQGIWQHGPLWLRPIVSVSPWAAAFLSLAVMYVAGSALSSASGILFDLPDAPLAEDDLSSLVAVVLPLKNETAVMFDDARYFTDDAASMRVFSEHFTDCLSRVPKKTLLVLADRRIPYGDLARFASVVRTCGAERVLFANRRSEEGTE